MSADLQVPVNPAWRELLATPPDVQFQQGRLCPLDRTCLRLQADKLPTPPSWTCTACGAWWDKRGCHGRWLTEDGQVDGRVAARRRLDRWTATAVAAGTALGLGAGVGRQLSPGDLVVSDPLLALLAVGLLVAGAAVYGVLWLLRWFDGRRYAGNVLLGPVEPSAVEACDGRR